MGTSPQRADGTDVRGFYAALVSRSRARGRGARPQRAASRSPASRRSRCPTISAAAGWRLARGVEQLLATQPSELHALSADLSRISRAEPTRAQVDLGGLARDTLTELQRATPERNVEVTIASGLTVCADPELMRTALDNLLGNAWKFTATRDRARIEDGERKEDGERVFFVRDDGIGFDMAYADKLFKPFHRLHHVSEFPGTGIGLVSQPAEAGAARRGG